MMFDHKLNKECKEEQAKRNTERFLKSQDINYKLNKKIAEDYRYWEPVGMDNINASEVDGFQLWLMEREQLITSLAHCYRTLQHVHNKYLDSGMEISKLKLIQRSQDPAADEDGPEIFEV